MSRSRSPRAVLPGSRQVTTSRPCCRSTSASSRICVDLPTPSTPSKLKNMGLFRPVQAFIDNVLGSDGAEGSFDVAALAEVETAGRGGPADGVGNHALHAGVVIDGKRLVAGAEIDDFAFAPPPGAAAAKDFAALEPTDGKQLVGRRNVEMLAVHFAPLDFKALVRESFGNRVRRIDDPDPLSLGRFSPAEHAGRPHQP